MGLGRLQRGALVLLVLLVTLSALPIGVWGALPCERSGYCSLGKTKPYVGEVDSSLGLKAALAARSYRREVILLSSDGERMLPAIQAVSNLLRLGLEHVMMMGHSGPDCIRVASAVPTAGCVWLDFELPVFGADREYVVPAIPMWHNRYRIAGRAVRMSYNVFLVDTDVIFFDDPYVYFKSPPFANYTMINQPEVLYDQSDYRTETEPNGGVLYIQNAAPDGPAAWLLAEVTHRLLRWVEDGFNTTRHVNGLVTWCNYMDQDGMRDAITSVLLGKIFFGTAMRDCRTDAWKDANGNEHTEIVHAVDDALRGLVSGADVDLPPALHAVAGEQAVHVRHFTMRLPAYTPWDTKFGPYLYPPRGPLSTQWLQQLKDDCGCPMWPDPEVPEDAARAAAIPPEMYLLSPPFLLFNWFARGRLGYWHRALTPAGPQQVVGHLHYIPGTDAALGKTVAKMAVGHYDWASARAVLGPRMYFLHQGSGHVQPFHEAQPGGHTPLHLLALHPALAAALGATRSWREYSELLAGLMMTAAALKRIPVWPDPPCSAAWIAERGPQGATSLPLDIRMEFIPYGRKRSSMSCVWLPLLNSPCLLSGRGMLSLEFAHWKSQVRMQGSFEPADHNTIGQLSAELGPSAPPANATPTARIFNVPLDEVARAWGLRKTHGQKVLYLLNPLNVTFPPAMEEAWSLADSLQDCKATNPQDVAGDLEDKPYRTILTPTLRLVPARVGPSGLIEAAPAIPGYNVRLPTPPAPSAPPGDAADAVNTNAEFAVAAITADLVTTGTASAGTAVPEDPAARVAAMDAMAATAAADAHKAAAASGADRAAAGGAATGTAGGVVANSAASALTAATAAAAAAVQAANAVLAAQSGVVLAADGTIRRKKKKKRRPPPADAAAAATAVPAITITTVGAPTATDPDAASSAGTTAAAAAAAAAAATAADPAILGVTSGAAADAAAAAGAAAAGAAEQGLPVDAAAAGANISTAAGLVQSTTTVSGAVAPAAAAAATGTISSGTIEPIANGSAAELPYAIRPEAQAGVIPDISTIGTAATTTSDPAAATATATAAATTLTTTSATVTSDPATAAAAAATIAATAAADGAAAQQGAGSGLGLSPEALKKLAEAMRSVDLTKMSPDEISKIAIEAVGGEQNLPEALRQTLASARAAAAARGSGPDGAAIGGAAGIDGAGAAAAAGLGAAGVAGADPAAAAATTSAATAVAADPILSAAGMSAAADAAAAIANPFVNPAAAVGAADAAGAAASAAGLLPGATGHGVGGAAGAAAAAAGFSFGFGGGQRGGVGGLRQGAVNGLGGRTYQGDGAAGAAGGLGVGTVDGAAAGFGAAGGGNLNRFRGGHQTANRLRQRFGGGAAGGVRTDELQAAIAAHQARLGQQGGGGFGGVGGQAGNFGRRRSVLAGAGARGAAGQVGEGVGVELESGRGVAIGVEEVEGARQGAGARAESGAAEGGEGMGQGSKRR